VPFVATPFALSSSAPPWSAAETKLPVAGSNSRTIASDAWHEHVRSQGPYPVGLTPQARATIEVLGINERDAVTVRRSLMAEGMYPA
jgi:hypothetical protein